MAKRKHTIAARKGGTGIRTHGTIEETLPWTRTTREGEKGLRLASMLALAVLFPGLAAAQQPVSLILHREPDLEVQAYLQAALNGVAERQLFWDLADLAAPDSGYDPNKNWLEGYVKPGLGFTWRTGGADVYGKISAVGSFTRGTDAYETGDTGRFSLEEGYLGLLAPLGEDLTLDLSLGPRELRLGSGMLISNGGSNGFERGALKLGPRKAWQMAATGTLRAGGMSMMGYYIDPNEMPSSDNGNRLAGADLRYDMENGDYLGASYIHVLESSTPYPQAAPGGNGPPTIIPEARDSLNAINIYGRSQPFSGILDELFITADAAYEWNPDVNMRAWAGRLQVGYTFTALNWRPQLTLSWQSFSGDDPNTSTLERFDPLYYDGSPAAWATGSKSAMTFINSNVQSIGAALRVSPSERDTVTLRYSHVRANELRSPIQFGQSTRVDIASGVDNIVAGVTDYHLSDDVFIEYSRIINPNVYLTTGFSLSVPGKGIEDVYPGNDPVWTGGYLNVVVNY